MPERGTEKEKKSLGIYVHIPFCVKKCEYCDFLSQVGTYELQQQYCQCLQKEIEQAACRAGDYEVDTIFIGGGTPSVLEPEWIEEILQKIMETFSIDRTDDEKGKSSLEVTIECNPGTLNRKKVQIYKRAGINRISLGLQSADNRELKLLGRIHTWEQFLESAALVKEQFDNWNVDIMSALPGQTQESCEWTLKQVLSLQPPHISAYSLIIEEGTPFYKRYAEDEQLRQMGERPRVLPDEESERAMYERTGELLAENGYHRYEISNYAKPGYASRHNMRYWLRRDYMGFGLGASSCMQNVRFKNTSDMQVYMQAGTFPKEEVCRLSTEEQMEEMMFLGLRLMQGVDQEAFFEAFKRTPGEVYGGVIASLEKSQLLKHSGKYIQLTQKGIDISNYVLSQFLLT